MSNRNTKVNFNQLQRAKENKYVPTSRGVLLKDKSMNLFFYEIFTYISLSIKFRGLEPTHYCSIFNITLISLMDCNLFNNFTFSGNV